MDMVDQLLEFTPMEEVLFDFKPNSTLSSVISLKNIHKFNVAFKVKTTCPNIFLVRPNQGILIPHSHAEVQIIMQPCNNFPEQITKFLILSRKTDMGADTDTQTITAFWQNPDYQDDVRQYKLTARDSNSAAIPACRESFYQEASLVNRKSSTMGDLKEAESLKQRYTELLKFKTQLEKEKEDIQTHSQMLEESAAKPSVTAQAPSLSAKKEGIKYSMTHLLVAFIIGVIIGSAILR